MKYILFALLVSSAPAFAQYDDPYASEQNSRYVEQLNMQQQSVTQSGWQQQQSNLDQYHRDEDARQQQPQPAWQPMGGVDLRGPDLR